MSLRNTRKADELSEESSKLNNFNNPEFLKISMKYTQNKDKHASYQNNGVRRRNSTIRGPIKNPNKTLRENEDHGVRRYGFTASSVRGDENFMREVYSKINPGHSGTDFQETNWKQSFRRGTADWITMDNEEDNDDNIDQISGKMDRKFAKELRKIMQS